jgi:site-specific DNA-adenine methylase
MRIGREVKRQVVLEDLKRQQREQVHSMTQESRKQLAETLMHLPKDKIIPAMRSAGLDDEANDLEQQFAQEHLMEMRQQRLAEIYAMPEDEQLGVLIAEGYTEEAKELSERLAADKEEVTEEEAPAEEAPDEAAVATEPEVLVPEPEKVDEAPAKEPAVKKKSGRPKKSAKK